jgi:predicted lipoprotein with Yx(FWY)xxD motif
VFRLASTLSSVTAIALVAAVCASPSGESAAQGASLTQPAAATKSKGPKLRVIDSDFGRILADGRGRALYLFTADTGEASTCSDDCAVAWPPWIVKGKPRAASGVRGKLIGTTRREDGRLQATYRGHPLYYYVGDRAPGEVTCQAVFEFGGYWYVVRSSGKAVT